MSRALKLWRLSSNSASLGDTSTAVVWAYDESDARTVFDEAMASDGRAYLPGYWEGVADPYVIEEVACERGPVLADGQDG